ncbi:MAG: ribonuclease P protein component [Myxococcales bacterium]|nr:ribonuclease P protein component [Myxococcales bacterium]
MIPPALPLATDRRYRPSDRLRRRSEFLRVQGGRKFSTHRLIIVAAPAAGEGPRFGVTVSKKVGCSPVRNQVKRWLREAFRLNKAAWPRHLDFVAIARGPAATAGFRALERDLLRWAQTASKAP